MNNKLSNGLLLVPIIWTYHEHCGFWDELFQLNVVRATILFINFIKVLKASK